MEKVNQTINSMKTHLGNAWDKIEEKGGTVPENRNMVNLPDAIRSIKK